MLTLDILSLLWNGKPNASIKSRFLLILSHPAFPVDLGALKVRSLLLFRHTTPQFVNRVIDLGHAHSIILLRNRLVLLEIKEEVGASWLYHLG